MNRVRATVVTSPDAWLQRVHLVELIQSVLFQRGIEAAATVLQAQAAAPDSRRRSERHFRSDGRTKSSAEAFCCRPTLNWLWQDLN